MKDLIPQAMAWKYGAKCSKNKEGDDIDKWEHPTEAKPTKAQVAIDVIGYKDYISSGQQAEDEKEKQAEKKENKAILKTIAEVTGLPYVDIKSKFKSYL